MTETSYKKNETKFQLRIPSKDKWYNLAGSTSITRSPFEEQLSREYTISISFLCEILCSIAEKYYNANKEKFDFFQYNIVDEQGSSILRGLPTLPKSALRRISPRFCCCRREDIHGNGDVEASDNIDSQLRSPHLFGLWDYMRG